MLARCITKSLGPLGHGHGDSSVFASFLLDICLSSSKLGRHAAADVGCDGNSEPNDGDDGHRPGTVEE